MRRFGRIFHRRTFMGSSVQSPSDFRREATQAIHNAEAMKRFLNEATTDRKMKLIALDAISSEICAVMDAAQVARTCHMDDDFISAGEEALQDLGSYLSALNTDEALFNNLRKIVDAPDFETAFTEEEKEFAKDLRREFEISGASLDDERQKIRSVALQNALSEAESEYLHHAYSGEEGTVVGPLPDEYYTSISSAASQFVPQTPELPPRHVLLSSRGGIIPSILTYVDDEDVRMQVWAASCKAPSPNTGCLGRIIRLRQGLARELGHASHSHKVLQTRILRDPSAVWRLISEVSDRTSAGLEAELRLLDWRSERAIQPWNIKYCIQRYWSAQSSTTKVDPLSAVAEYFPLTAVMEGLQMVTSELFGLKVEDRAIEAHETWGWSPGDGATQGMCKLVLLDASGQLVGTVYVDLFQRHKKIGQPAHLTLQCGCADTKGFIKTLIKEGRGSDYSQTQATSMPWQPPVVALLLSFPRSAHSADPCLSLQDVETLYHEFGHALHSLLSRTTFQHLSGTRGSVDFVEVPSHWFEHFARTPSVVTQWARHFQSGLRIPSGLLEEALAVKNRFQNIETQSQLLFTAADQLIFGDSLDDMSGASDEACYAAAKDKIAAWQRDDSRIPLGRDSDGSAIIGMNLLSHSHFVAYGGDYFAYIFAKAKANEIWDLHFSNKPLRADKGKLMWKTMLAKGAGRPPVKILKDILSAQR